LEFPTWRRLDLQRAFESLGVQPFPPQAAKSCWFFNRPEPWIMSDDIGYALTHDIFYLTDFGRDVTQLPSECIRYLEDWLPSWLGIFLKRPNWDLVAELLMVGSCLRSEASTEYYEALLSAAEDDGLVPSPPGSGAQLIALEEDVEPRRRRFLSNYHTCLVSCMALGMRKLRE
ncbi:DUF6895 family protein, partial [Streptococcus pyogenes]|uniref:DUF6895 family protein n=1 Tax=Streptococcus pyogenes TaxID=1314 RepID=UPI003DA0B17C